MYDPLLALVTDIVMLVRFYKKNGHWFQLYAIIYILLTNWLRIELKKYADSANRPQKQYNVYKLKSREIKLEFNCAVRNRFEALEDMTEDSIDIVWATLQETWKEAGKREKT